MSLSPTPPRPVQRNDDEKENQVLTPKKSIGWAVTKDVFEISPSAFQSPKSSRVLHKPRKSILKPARPLQPFHPEKKRDFTPMPDDALSDTAFLQYPVSVIISITSSLRDLTEAYNILASRIRTSVPTEFWQQSVPDLKCPLFQPLRSNANVLAAAIKRDLGRILENSEESDEESSSPRLPTPRSSPKKESPSKGGMTEEEVKFARDITTVTTSAIKFLILAFQTPSLYSAFSTKQLQTLLTGVLGIPLMNKFRSPSTRKICGFAIQLLQSQRLPDEVLIPARDRMLYALKKAINGELGREGKKGSASEAFRAVHDLSLYRPSIFVPGMEHYISPVLDGLLAPSCVLRVQAAHALGGFSMAIARSGSEFDNFIRNVSPTVVEFFLRAESGTSKQPQPTILKTLRTTLRTTEPVHHAQGPLWAISVLSSLTILFGPELLRNYELLTTYRDVVNISFKSKKLVFRSAMAMLWGPLIWTWKKWRHAPEFKQLAGSEENDEIEVVKMEFRNLLMRMNHTPVGILLYGTLLGDSHETCLRTDLLQVFAQLSETVRRYKGDLTSAALAVLERLVNTREDDEFYENWEERFQTRLIPQQLFSVSPGLLTTEMNMKTLETAVETIVLQMARVDDVRPLSEEEKSSRQIFAKALDVWDACLEQLQLLENETIPDVFVDTWSGIIRMGLLEREEQRSVMLFAEQCAGHLSSIFINPSVDMRDNENGTLILGDPITSSDNVVFKFALVRSLWSALVGILPSYAHGNAAKTLVRFLVEKREMFVQNISEDASEKDKEALSEWAQLVAQVVAVSSSGFTKQFWSIEFGWDERSLARVWRAYVRGWTDEGRGSWEGAMVLLGRPFSDNSPWDMSDPDLSAWNSLLSYALEGAAGYLSHAEFLERLVEHIDRRHLVTLSSVVRVADYLLSSFLRTIERCTTLPSKFIELIHDILSTSYPPPPRNKIVAIWLLRSLVSVISNCPSDLVVELLENILEGLVTWISDDCRLFTSEEYTSEIIPLYEMIIVSLQSLPPTSDVLQSLSMLIASALQVEEYTGSIRPEREEALTAFTEFWSTSCRHLQEPRGGWAEGIEHALHLAFPAETIHHTCEYEQDSEDELDILPNTTITPQRRLLQQLPPSPSPVRFHPVRKTTDMSSPLCRPSAKRARLSEPSCARTLFVDSPPSPTVYKSKRNSMAMPFAFSRSEKENVQPRYAGRGRADEDADEEVTFVGMRRTPVQKRARTFTCGSDDSEDARAVEAAIQVILSPTRRPFAAATARANVNPVGQTTTPSKRAMGGGMSVGSCPRLPTTSSSFSPQRRTKPNSSCAALGTGRIVSAGRKRHRGQFADEDSDEEDDWLPPSSDPESEEDPDEDAEMEQAPDLVEDLGSSSSILSSSSSGSSSSPIRTPKSHSKHLHAVRRSLPYGAHDLRIQVESDEEHMASSPISKRRTVVAAAYPHSKRVTPPLVAAVPAFAPLSPLI